MTLHSCFQPASLTPHSTPLQSSPPPPSTPLSHNQHPHWLILNGFFLYTMHTLSFVHLFLQFVPLLCQVLLSLWLKDNPKEDSPVDTTLLSNAPPLFQDFLEKFDAWGSALLKVQNIKDSIKGTVAFKAK